MKRKVVVSGLLFLVVSAAVLSIAVLGTRHTERQFEFVETSLDELKRTIRNKDCMVVFYGQEDCGSCAAYRPVVLDAARDMQMEVYFLNSDQVTDPAFLENYGIHLTPTLIVIQNGYLKGYEGSFDLETTKLLLSYGMKTTRERPEHITPVSYQSLSGKMSEEIDFLLYVGRPDCGDCQAFYPILEEYADTHDGAGVYYLNVKELRNPSAGTPLGTEVSDAYEQLKLELDLQWVPSLYHIINGKILSKYEYLSAEYYKIEEEDGKARERERFRQEFYRWMERSVGF